jgi:hypothetical protein
MLLSEESIKLYTKASTGPGRTNYFYVPSPNLMTAVEWHFEFEFRSEQLCSEPFSCGAVFLCDHEVKQSSDTTNAKRVVPTLSSFQHAFSTAKLLLQLNQEPVSLNSF